MLHADFDDLRDAEELPRSRLLFVAHREEIIDQSRATFRHALRDGAFREKWVGGHRPERFENVFASIQSLRSADVRNINPRHFDVVIVDEFHHAAAPSYEALLDQIEPIELLGLQRHLSARTDSMCSGTSTVESRPSYGYGTPSTRSTFRSLTSAYTMVSTCAVCRGAGDRDTT
jgi:Type III restriction enzyme, res subunit